MIEVFKDGVKINSGTAIDLNESSGIDIAGTGDGHKADFTISLEDSATEVATAATPALSITGSTTIDSTSNAVDATLGSGTYIGQTKRIVMTEASNSSTVSIALHESSDPEVATFNAVDEYLVLEWSGTEWVTIKATATFV